MFDLDISDFLDEPTCVDHVARLKMREMEAADQIERAFEISTDESLEVFT